MSTLLDALYNVAGTVGNALDTPRRLAWRGAGALTGLDIPDHGNELVSNLTGLDRDSFLAHALGFGAEAALDPMNLLGGLAWRGLSRGVKAARANNALREARLATGGMPEEIAGLTKIAEGGMPKRVLHGTGAVFERPDAAKFRDDAIFGRGYYTTDSPATAGGYAGEMMTDGYLVQEAKNRKDFVDDTYAHVKQMLDSGAPNKPGVKPWSEQVTYLDDAKRAAAAELEALLARGETATHTPNIRANYLDIRNPFDVDKTHPMGPLADALGGIGSMTADDIRLPRQMPGQAVFDLLDAELGGPAKAAEALKRAGYDGITHVGGARTGNAAHNVAIAFDPSQVYSPWIAPAYQKVPNQSPLLAALAGYNVARPTLRQRTF